MDYRGVKIRMYSHKSFPDHFLVYTADGKCVSGCQALDKKMKYQGTCHF